MVGCRTRTNLMVEVRRRLRIPADLERLADLRAVVRDVAEGCEAPGGLHG